MSFGTPGEQFIGFGFGGTYVGFGAGGGVGVGVGVGGADEVVVVSSSSGCGTGFGSLCFFFFVSSSSSADGPASTGVVVSVPGPTTSGSGGGGFGVRTASHTPTPIRPAAATPRIPKSAALFPPGRRPDPAGAAGINGFEGMETPCGVPCIGGVGGMAVIGAPDIGMTAVPAIGPCICTGIVPACGEAP